MPACTLITGLSQETEEDAIRTIELMDDLKDFKSLIVPLFFVPLGKFKNEDGFKIELMSDLQKELLVKCLRHDIRWVKVMINFYFRGKWYSPISGFLCWFFVKLIERKARRLNV